MDGRSPPIIPQTPRVRKSPNCLRVGFYHEATRTYVHLICRETILHYLPVPEHPRLLQRPDVHLHLIVLQRIVDAGPERACGKLGDLAAAGSPHRRKFSLSRGLRVRSLPVGPRSRGPPRRARPPSVALLHANQRGKTTPPHTLRGGCVLLSPPSTLQQCNGSAQAGVAAGFRAGRGPRLGRTVALLGRAGMPNNIPVALMSSSMSGQRTPNPLPMNSRLLRWAGVASDKRHDQAKGTLMTRPSARCATILCRCMKLGADKVPVHERDVAQADPFRIVRVGPLLGMRCHAILYGIAMDMPAQMQEMRLR
jgi:hypothetical protein